MAVDCPSPGAGRIARRWERISAARGLATLLIVAFHVIGGTPDAGMRLPEDHLLRRIIQILGYLPMPLFAVVAGNLYAMRPVQGSQAIRFLRHRLWQFGLPFLVNSTVFFLVQAMLHGQLNAPHLAGIWRIYLYPFSIFWFLWAMLVVLALACVLDLARITRHPAGLFAIVLLAFAERLLPPDRLVFLSLDGAIHLLPFFLCGLAARRFPTILASRGALLGLGLAAGLAFAIHLLNVFALLPPAEALSRVGVIGPVIGAAGSLVLLRVMPASPMFVGIGRSALTIYLFQVYYMVAARMALLALGVTDTAVHFILGTTAGILGPIWLEPLILRFTPLRVGMLGMRR